MCRVLLVCEEQSLVRQVQHSLEPRGFLVDTRTDTSEAVVWLRDNDANLLILYVPTIAHCPDEVRWLLRQVRNDPATAGVRVLVISGTGGDQVVDHGFEGMHMYMTKWFHPAELLVTVKWLLRT